MIFFNKIHFKKPPHFSPCDGPLLIMLKKKLTKLRCYTCKDACQVLTGTLIILNIVQESHLQK